MVTRVSPLQEARMKRHCIALGFLCVALAIAPRSSLAGDEVVSASSGSKTAAAYDEIAKLLASADDASAAAPSALPGHDKSAALIARIHRYAAAEQQAVNAL